MTSDADSYSCIFEVPENIRCPLSAGLIGVDGNTPQRERRDHLLKNHEKLITVAQKCRAE